MVFLSEASIRQMVQEALGGGGYPSLDGDGNFPIIPSPLAEPIVTKLALQPVRVMRIPTDRNEFELAVSELVDGVEDDHLPTLFLKLRELVSDFVPPELEHSPCPTDCSPKDDQMSNNSPPDDEEMKALRAEVRRLITTILEEADEEEDTLSMWKPGGARYRPPPFKQIGISGGPPVPRDIEDPSDGDDWDLDAGGDWDDDGAAETDPGDEPYPEEYLKNPGYPSIGEDPDFDTWEDLEKEIAKSAWEPGAELDKFRGRDTNADWDEASGGAHGGGDVAAVVGAKAGKKDTISKVTMTLDDIAKDKDFEGMSVGALHGMIAKASRKLGYVARDLDDEDLNQILDDSTDKFINFLIKQGAQKGEDGKPALSMSDVMDLRSAVASFDEDEKGRRIRSTLDAQAENMRKAIQELPLFREYLSAVIEDEMEKDEVAVSHKDAAKDKDKHSVIHRMKSTTR